MFKSFALIKNTIAGLVIASSLAACATTSHTAIQTEKPTSAARAYSGPRHPIVVGKFDNHSGFMQGLFSDGVDKLGSQSKTILVGHLRETNRFTVMDRTNMGEIAQEAKFKKANQNIKGADYAITGDVTEFGRKEIGDTQLFGVLGSGKQQIAYSKVMLNVVDTTTSEVVFSSSGAGEYALSNREVIGFGGTAGYDSTLNGKVLDLAIREAIDRLVEGLEQGQWSVTKAGK